MLSGPTDEEKYENTSSDDLSETDIDVDKKDVSYLEDARKYTTKALKHDFKRVKQAHAQRTLIFRFSLWASGAVIVLSTALVTLSLLIPDWRMDNTVYVAYVSGNAIQFVGLLTVVAKYVFSDQATSKLFSSNRSQSDQ